jgi:hypothetical protein
MVEIIEKKICQIDKISLEEVVDYYLIVTREDNKITQIEFKDKTSSDWGFTLSRLNLNSFVQLIKEFINVRQL